MFKIVILAGSAHNFNFSVNSYMLVKVSCLKTFEEVMKGKNSPAVVGRQEEDASSENGRELKNSQNKVASKEGGRERSEQDADPILNEAKTRFRRNTSQRMRVLKNGSRRDKRQERDDRMGITSNYKNFHKTYGQFKARMVEHFGESFFYLDGSWHGEESRRYRKYHIKKSMRFLTANMEQ